jgi:serine/threonine protein kinase
MDRISGPSLDELRASRSRIAPSIVAWVLLGMSRALAYLHAHKIVHRDLKPSNILIGSDQQVYLVDFGLAKCFVDSQLTRRSELVGTPGYLAPELIQGATIDGRCDLFSLGMVSLELLLGEATVKGDNPYTVMLNLTEGRFLRASEHGEIPRQLARIIDRLLEVDPDQRTQSAAALEEELASCQQLIDLAPSKLS